MTGHRGRVWFEEAVVDIARERTDGPNLSSLEAYVDGVVPDDYRWFLEEIDGLTFVDFTELPGTQLDGARELFALTPGGPTDRTLGAVNEVWRTMLPAELLAIGDDLGGNLICIVTRGPAFGSVLFWDHELPLGDGRPPLGDAAALATSFEEFARGLRLVDESSDGRS